MAAEPDQTAAAPASFEEFRLYYESTERVTDRRLATNRWNHSVCVAILLAIAVTVKSASDSSSFVFVGVCAVVLLAVMAALFCTYWLGQISDWKALNEAKFAVLNRMAPRIAFYVADQKTDARSFDPFAREWEALKRTEGALQNVRTKKRKTLLALRSSGAELFMPRAWRALFIAIAVATVATAVANWSTVTDQLSPFAPAKSESQRASEDR
jgi:hypothetical protein